MWGGKTVTGNFSHMGIGTENRFTTIAVDSKEIYRFTSMADSGTARTSDGKLLTLSTEMTMEGDYYILIPLLQEAINSKLIEVEYIRSATESLESGHVRIIRHQAHWHPSMREFGSAQFDIFVDPSGNTVSRISNRRHFDGVMNHSIEHSLIFSDYHAESGWLVPHSIEERYVGKTLNRLTVKSFTFNNHLKASDFAAQ
jgi:hypothetical protein